MSGITLGAVMPGDPRIIGSTAFTCDLCMATGPRFGEPCPFHADRTWAEWMTDAFKEWAWTVLRDSRRPTSGTSSDPTVSAPLGQTHNAGGGA